MKTAVAQTSINAHYDRVVPTLAATQNSRVMAVIRPGKNYTLSELMRLVPGIDKSSMSRVVNGLRAANRLQPAPERKCSISGVTVTPSRLPVRSAPEQDFLFPEIMTALPDQDAP